LYLAQASEFAEPITHDNRRGNLGTKDVSIVGKDCCNTGSKPVTFIDGGMSYADTSNISDGVVRPRCQYSRSDSHGACTNANITVLLCREGRRKDGSDAADSDARLQENR
jgi:hypothetical protein